MSVLLCAQMRVRVGRVILHMCMHGLYLQQLRREKAALRQNNLASRCADAGKSIQMMTLPSR